jgi:hypothetical protein
MNVGLMAPAELAIEDTLRELRKLNNTGVDTELMILQLEATQSQLRERITAKRALADMPTFGEEFARPVTVTMRVDGPNAQQ